jgi:tRNA threonylcarbamoyladenosine dehydratase
VVLDRLKKATVAVVGIGGVGSWAAESLCRSGVGNIILIDLDDICISNTNRQLHAMTTTVGNLKIDVTKERISHINPSCNVTTIFDFVSKLAVSLNCE